MCYCILVGVLEANPSTGGVGALEDLEENHLTGMEEVPTSNRRSLGSEVEKRDGIFILLSFDVLA